MLAPYVMLLVWANPLRGQVGGGWALEIETFWPCNVHEGIRNISMRGFMALDVDRLDLRIAHILNMEQKN